MKEKSTDTPATPTKEEAANKALVESAQAQHQREAAQLKDLEAKRQEAHTAARKEAKPSKK